MRILNRYIQATTGHTARFFDLLRQKHRALPQYALPQFSNLGAQALSRVIGERGLVARSIKNMSKRFGLCLGSEISAGNSYVDESSFAFEPQNMKKPVNIDEQRAAFLKRYFDIATREYEAAAGYLAPLIHAMSQSRDGKLYILDVGCGQGHMFRAVMNQLPEEVKKRIVIDYLDPQIENLFRYEENVDSERLGMRYCARWEEFYSDRTKDRLNDYDLIVAFQSLYSFDLEAHGDKLKGLRGLLKTNGRAIIGHCPPHTVYFQLFRDVGHLFHKKLPRLNTVVDITDKLDELEVLYEENQLPVNQEIHSKNEGDLLVYLAACLYLMSTQPIQDCRKQVSAGIQNYLTKEGNYVFPQDITFINIPA